MLFMFFGPMALVAFAAWFNTGKALEAFATFVFADAVMSLFYALGVSWGYQGEPNAYIRRVAKRLHKGKK